MARPCSPAARKAYKRMSQGELDIAIRRKTRSGLRYLHVLEGASAAEIEAYKAANKPALDDPFAALGRLLLEQGRRAASHPGRCAAWRN